jgi:hypothetical protein
VSSLAMSINSLVRRDLETHRAAQSKHDLHQDFLGEGERVPG